MVKPHVVKITICVLMAVMCSCKTHSHINEVTIDEMEIPPNGIKISSNLYIDKTEITNDSYAGFAEWLRHIYGQGSEEYKSVLPDVTGWGELGKSYYRLADHYFQHPAYWRYPVVNITYDQAKLYCKWRSDRFMEFILIREGIIKHIPNPHKDSVFTIENYFKGNYRGITPNKGLMIYPEYSLPDSSVFVSSLKVSDSLYKTNYKYARQTDCYAELKQVHCLENIAGRNDTLLYGIDPVAKAYYADIRRLRLHKINLVTHLLGNIREMTNIQGLTFGGSYIDSCAAINRNYFIKEKGSNCYTGFRCVCTYKKWETK
jgi:hypothetical protein